MKELFLIVKILIKNVSANNLAFGRRKNSRKKSSSSRIWITLIAYLIIFLAFLTMTYSTMMVGPKVGLREEVFKPSLFFVMLVTFSVTFLSCFSVYFLSKDNEVYLSLPIKPTTLFWGRFLASGYFSGLTALTMLAPLFISYMLIFGFSGYALLTMLVLTLVFSIVVNVVSFVLGNILATFFNLAAHREAFSVIMSIFMVAIIVVMSFLYSNNSQTASGGTDLAAIKANLIAAFNSLAWADFFLWLPTKATVAADPVALLYLFYMILIAVGFTAVALFFARFFYIKNLLNGNTGQKKKNVPADKSLALFEHTAYTQEGKLLPSYIKREVRSTLRSGLTAFNFIFPTVLIGIAMTAILLFFALSPTKNAEELAEKAQVMPLLFLIFVAIVPMAPTLSSISLSKEGKDLESLRTMPLDKKAFILAKLIPSFTIEAIPVVLLTLIGLATGTLGIALPLVTLPIMLLFVAAVNLFDLYFESKYAVVDWQNEIQYLRRFSSNIPHMGLIAANIVVVVVLAVLMMTLRLPQILAIVIMLPIYIGLFVWFLSLIKRKFYTNIDKLYE